MLKSHYLQLIGHSIHMFMKKTKPERQPQYPSGIKLNVGLQTQSPSSSCLFIKSLQLVQLTSSHERHLNGQQYAVAGRFYLNPLLHGQPSIGEFTLLEFLRHDVHCTFWFCKVHVRQYDGQSSHLPYVMYVDAGHTHWPRTFIRYVELHTHSWSESMVPGGHDVQPSISHVRQFVHATHLPADTMKPTWQIVHVPLTI